jgi:adenine-specific DNA-methyltransferase
MSQLGVMSEQYSKETLEFLSKSNLEERNKIGQYFTPKYLRTSLLKHLDFKPGDRVLDPGVGTGEFLKDALALEPTLKVEGWDIDQEVLKVAKKLVKKGKFVCASALDYEKKEQFDFVIGNPPYFEMKNLEEKYKNKYSEIIGGRVNIFSLFFKVGLDVLKPGGVLAYVVPPSMNNGAYFNKLREYIVKHGDIKSIEIFNSDLFIDAQTSVMIIVIVKSKNKGKFFLKLSDHVNQGEERILFSPEIKKLKSEFKGKSSLYDLGYEVHTGSCIWNVNKERLYDAPGEGRILLVYSHNIVNNKILLSNKKKQYVKLDSYLTGKALVVNRVTGGVGQGELKCALIKSKVKFLGENHVNVITKRAGVKQLVSFEELHKLLTHPNIKMRLRILTGNTQLSAKELAYYLPLDHPGPTSS